MRGRRLAGAQQSIPVIGILGGSTQEGYAQQTGFLLAGLKDAGFVDGQTLRIEYRWADEQIDRLPALAADLVSKRVSLIVTEGGTFPARAAMAATTTIPIVFVTGATRCKPSSLQTSVIRAVMSRASVVPRTSWDQKDLKRCAEQYRMRPPLLRC